MRGQTDVQAPCGVFCGACPSYNKTCAGCASEKKVQQRKSKWSCKIRNCCYNEKELSYCAYCDQFPCKTLTKKLIDSHPGDERYTYRHEIRNVFTKLKDMEFDCFLEYQNKRWSCPSCGGRVYFYTYACSECGKKVTV